MKVLLRKYRNYTDFVKDLFVEEQEYLTLMKAMDVAKEEVAKVRNTLGWVGFKIIDVKSNKVKHKLF